MAWRIVLSVRAVRVRVGGMVDDVQIFRKTMAEKRQQSSVSFPKSDRQRLIDFLSFNHVRPRMPYQQKMVKFDQNSNCIWKCRNQFHYFAGPSKQFAAPAHRQSNTKPKSQEKDIPSRCYTRRAPFWRTHQIDEKRKIVFQISES